MAVTVETLEIDVQTTGAASAVSALQSVRSAISGVASSGGTLTATAGKVGALGTAAATSSKGVSTLSSSFGKMLSFVFVARMVSKGLSSIVTESTAYTENLNLFTVAMGEYADSALAYAEKVQDAIGIDMSDWIRSQGVFKMLFSGFGTGAEQAATMSQNLTQLGYDIASFYNTSVDTAMKKLQSGIVGQTKSVREYGYDVSNATLKEIALARGIDEKVTSMTAAEKATLRYIALMEQNTSVQGDMARTLESPANQLRIFSSQVTLAARALGNIFIPALNAVLPAAIAFLQVIRDVASAIASLFGFEMFEVDYSSLDSTTESVDNLDDSLTNAGGSAKKLKGQLAGFDELNVISQTSSGGGGGGGSGGTSSWLDDLVLPTYDFLAGLKEKATSLKDEIAAILPWIEAVALGLLAWKFPALGLALDFGITYLAFMDALTNGFTKENIIQMVIGVLVGTIGGWVITGSLAGGLAIGVGIAIAAMITAFVVKNNQDYQKKIQEAFDAGFGTVTLTGAQTAELASAFIKSNTFYITVHTLLDAYAEVEALKPEIANVVAQLDLLPYKVAIGAKIGTEELSEYETSISTLAKDLTDYAAQNGKFVSIAVQMGEISAEGGAAVATLTAANIAYIESLGKKANELFSESFSEDGVLTNWDTYAEAMKYIQKLQQFSDIVAASKQTAALQTLQLQWSGATLTSESYLSFQSELGKLSDQLKTDAETAFQDKLSSLNSTISFAQLTIEANPEDINAQKALETAQAELDRLSKDNTYQLEMDKIDLQVSDMAYNTIADTLKDFTDKVITRSMSPYIMTKFAEAWGDPTAWSAVNWSDAAGVIAQDITDTLSGQFKKYPKEVQEGIVLMVNDGALSAANKIKTLQSLRDAGGKLPEAVVDGINTYETAAAMTGSADAMWYLTGKAFAESPDYMQSLGTVAGLAAGLNTSAAQGLASNIDVIKSGVNGSLTAIVDGVETNFPTITLTLAQNFAALGIDLRDYVSNLPSDIDSYLTTVFGKQDFSFAVDASLTVNTTVTEKVKYATSLTSAGVKSVVENTVSPAALNIAAFKKVAGIPEFAGGGFPETGQYFLARENGVPEMVGTMGGQTAVANNDQIVEGITSGVEAANEKQNALLREQNELLRALLEKDNTMEPSAAWGAFVAKSNAAYAKAVG